MFIARAAPSSPSPGGATDTYMPLLTELGDLGAPDERQTLRPSRGFLDML